MSKKENSVGFAITGVLIIAAAIVGTYFLPATMVIRYLSSTNWVAVPAQIGSLKLVENRSSDSTSYKVEASYICQFNDVQYTSNQVTFNAAADSEVATGVTCQLTTAP